MEENIQFKLNGKSTRLTVNSDRMLLWVVRTELGLTGTKYGCGEGHCGACTVIVNNEAVRSCQTFMKDVQSKEVITIEGLAKNGKVHPIQRAFMDTDAMQCGYCTPGFIMSAAKLLEERPQPGRDEIMQAITGNLCRCTGYYKIVQAIEDASNL